MSFALAALGYATLFASLIVLFPIGVRLDLGRRYHKWRWIRMLALCALALTFGVCAYFIGRLVPPLIGDSENHVLFPGLALIGLLGGVFESSARFRRR